MDKFKNEEINEAREEIKNNGIGIINNPWINDPGVNNKTGVKINNEFIHEGFLLKWTNYLYGWQRRYVKIGAGALQYSIDNRGIKHFQGLVSLRKCVVKVHPKDELRFDINIAHAQYYFKAQSSAERMIWVNKILICRDEAFYSPNHCVTSLSSISSLSSLNSQILNFNKNSHAFYDLINEINNNKDLINAHAEELARTFDFLIFYLKNNLDKLPAGFNPHFNPLPNPLNTSNPLKNNFNQLTNITNPLNNNINYVTNSEFNPLNNQLINPLTYQNISLNNLVNLNTNLEGLNIQNNQLINQNINSDTNPLNNFNNISISDRLNNQLINQSANPQISSGASLDNISNFNNFSYNNINPISQKFDTKNDQKILAGNNFFNYNKNNIYNSNNNTLNDLTPKSERAIRFSTRGQNLQNFPNSQNWQNNYKSHRKCKSSGLIENNYSILECNKNFNLNSEIMCGTQMEYIDSTINRRSKQNLNNSSKEFNNKNINNDLNISSSLNNNQNMSDTTPEIISVVESNVGKLINIPSSMLSSNTSNNSVINNSDVFINESGKVISEQSNKYFNSNNSHNISRSNNCISEKDSGNTTNSNNEINKNSNDSGKNIDNGAKKGSGKDEPKSSGRSSWRDFLLFYRSSSKDSIDGEKETVKKDSKYSDTSGKTSGQASLQSIVIESKKEFGESSDNKHENQNEKTGKQNMDIGNSHGTSNGIQEKDFTNDSKKASGCSPVESSTFDFGSISPRENGPSSIDTTESMSKQTYGLKSDHVFTEPTPKVIPTPGYIVRRPMGHRTSKSSSQFPPDLSHPENDAFGYLTNQRIRLENCSLKFKTTANNLLAGITTCVEQIENTERSFKEELEKEREINQKLHQKIQELNKQLMQKNAAYGPDATSCQLDEVFYDALFNEMAIEEDIQAMEESTDGNKVEETVLHPYQTKVDDFEKESLEFLTSLPDDKSWTLVYNDPPTILFKKELLVDDIVLDPYRVVHLYQGVSAKEISTFFWDVKHRLKIDSHVDHVFVKAAYGEDTVVVHHLHKTIWPAARRDSLIISKRREIDDAKIKSDLTGIYTKEFKISQPFKCVGNSWMVSNVSIDYPDVAVHNCVRVDAKVGFLAQTFLLENSDEKKRENYYTLLNYSASINPGGWLPHSAVRTMARREFPKFLKNLGTVTFSNSSPSPIEI